MTFYLFESFIDIAQNFKQIAYQMHTYVHFTNVTQNLPRWVCFSSTISPRAFAILSLSAWNCLPVDLPDPSHSLLTFRRKPHMCIHLFCSLFVMNFYWLTSMLVACCSWYFFSVNFCVCEMPAAFETIFRKASFDNNKYRSEISCRLAEPLGLVEVCTKTTYILAHA